MVILDLSNKEYHKRPELSASDLKLFSRSPAHFKYGKNFPSEPNDSMRLGSLTHTILLEPDTYRDRYTEGGERLNWATKAGKEQKAFVELEASEGRVVVFDEEFNNAVRMRDSVMSHPAASELLTAPGVVESSIFQTIFEVPMRCRPDKLSADHVTILDIKTTTDARAWSFAKSAYEFGYHLQAAIYCDIVRLQFKTNPVYKIIAVESHPPYNTQVFFFSPEDVQLGRDVYQSLLPLYLECLEYNTWPGYSDKEQILYLPAYAHKVKVILK